MVISQKCNCCMHEEICSKSDSYKLACKSIKDNIGYFENGLIDVNIKCNHFVPKSRKQDGITIKEGANLG